VELRDRQDLNNGFGNALSRAVELVVTPMIFGFLGYLIDRRLGTGPAFMLVAFLVVFGYTLWKHYVLYSAAMDREQRRVLGDRMDR
jgi:F0F1-type ATP synthase assembly protein I